MRVRQPCGTLLFALVCAWASADAQNVRRSGISAAEIDAHLRYLSSDRLEGRAPGTRGGRLAVEYIVSALRRAGVQPGVGRSYLQPVPIDVVTADAPSMRAVATSGAWNDSLRTGRDIVLWAGSAVGKSVARAEIIFVGHGIDAPEFRWDDFKDLDLTGKILLVVVNDPPAPPREPGLFAGRAMTYYGRWSYKFEEAERRGAAGAMIVHTVEGTGYPWHTVVASWGGTQRMLPRVVRMPRPLAVRGWIAEGAAAGLLARAGLDFARLRRQAESRDFRPVATGITLDVSFSNTVTRTTSDNVVGVVPGRDARLREEYVAFSAHWDHLGIGPAVNGDSIYNGATDNASGVANVLAVARAAAQGPRPKRSLLFTFVTGEESGLLGSEYFVTRSPVPVGRIIANLNVDGGNLLGRTSDIAVIGDEASSLGPMLDMHVRGLGMRLSREANPEQGHFFRADHFSFAQAGVPAMTIGSGDDYIGRTSDWGRQQDETYTATRYHQPSDEYPPGVNLTGAVQLSEILLDFAISLANAPGRPRWNPDFSLRRRATQPPDK